MVEMPIKAASYPGFVFERHLLPGDVFQAADRRAPLR